MIKMLFVVLKYRWREWNPAKRDSEHEQMSIAMSTLSTGQQYFTQCTF